MAGFLLTMVLITDALLIGIGWKSARLVRKIRTRFAKLQASIVGLLCAAGVVASVQDIGVQVTALGWVPESVGKEFVGSVHALLVVGGLFVLVPVLWLLRTLTNEFATSEALTEMLVQRLPDGVTVESAGLTAREIEVVRAVADGHVSDREIADELIIAPATAATHVRNIMRKTGIKRRGDVVLLLVDQVET